jgi:hypothetical protein
MVDFSKYAARDERGPSGLRIDEDVIRQFLSAMFYEYGMEGNPVLGLRGLGEKGMAGEGSFRELKYVGLEGGAEVAAARVAEHAARWVQHGHGAFVIPGALRFANDEKWDQKEANVKEFTALCLDLDNPDTAELALNALDYALGCASIVVESSPGKRHAYWLLTEPTDDTRKVAHLREVLALKSGGDPCFKAVPQVIRLPGTFNQKGGAESDVRMLRCDPDTRHDLFDLAARIVELHPLPYAREGAQLALSQLESGPGSPRPPAPGAWDFAPYVAQGAGSALDLLTRQVREGGQDEKTRWQAFSGVCGHYLHTVRAGELTVDEARERCQGWMMANMLPPWPEGRFATEWTGLLNKELREKGPFPARQEAVWGTGELLAPDMRPAWMVAQESQENPLLAWSAHRWAVGPKPVRRWLVQGLLRMSGSHILASEGGVGKTFLLLDLCMKIAAPLSMMDAWCGQKINREHLRREDGSFGRTAVLITAEDDKDELHIRLEDLDPGAQRRTAAGDRLIILPLIQAGGAFPLVEIGHGGVPKASQGWANLLAQLTAIPDLVFVGVDTLAATLHGEENSALVLQQWVTALNAIQRALPDVATLGTHHVRKQGTKDAPILSATDMRNAIRGSNALLGAVRLVMGIWQPHDAKDTLTAIGERPRANALFRLAVVKANNPEAMSGERVLMRTPVGGLGDITERVDAVRRSAQAKADDEEHERLCWLLAAIGHAAQAGAAFTASGRRGLFIRRHELPPLLVNGTQAWLQSIGPDKLVQRGMALRTDKRSAQGEGRLYATGQSEAGIATFDTTWTPPDWATITPPTIPFEGGNSQ